MQFVGITRFNLVTSATLGHFNSTKKLSVEQAKDLVFSPDRLDAKMDTFETFCLPTYAALAQKDERSHALVLINHDLPTSYRERLEHLCAEVPRVRLVQFHDDDRIEAKVNPVLAEIAGTGRLFNYRYDDDDVLSPEFLRQVDDLAASADDDTVISMDRGLVVARLDQERFGIYEADVPLNAYGLGLITTGAHPRNIFELGRHDKIAEPTLHEVNTPSWVAFRHGLNDSQVNATELDRLKLLAEHAVSANALATDLAARFPQINAEALLGLPTLSIHENLDTIARRAIRRTRSLESALAKTRKELKTTRAELDRTRAALQDVKTSRSFQLVRSLASIRHRLLHSVRPHTTN